MKPPIHAAQTARGGVFFAAILLLAPPLAFVGEVPGHCVRFCGNGTGSGTGGGGSSQLYFHYSGWGLVSSARLDALDSKANSKTREFGLRIPLGAFGGLRVARTHIEVPDRRPTSTDPGYAGFSEKKTFVGLDLFHIAENYKVMTRERDIRREIAEKPARGGAKKERQDRLLKQADAMRAEAARVDAAYRRANGYELRPSK